MGRLKHDPGHRLRYEWLDSNPLYIWRNMKGWTVAQLAARIGSSGSAVSKWEDGTSLPSGSRLLELVELTGIKDLGQKLLDHRRRIPL